MAKFYLYGVAIATCFIMSIVGPVTRLSKGEDADYEISEVMLCSESLKLAISLFLYLKEYDYDLSRCFDLFLDLMQGRIGMMITIPSVCYGILNVLAVYNLREKFIDPGTAKILEQMKIITSTGFQSNI